MPQQTKKRKDSMKRFACIILLLLLFSLTSCSVLNEGILMPDITEDYTFENDTWLIFEDCLVNKTDGTAYWLCFEGRHDTGFSEATEFHRSSLNSYKYEFLESSVKEYTFLASYMNSSTPLYYEFVIEYDYNGKETDCIYIGKEALTRETMQQLLQEKAPKTEAFSFYVFTAESEHDNAAEEEQAIRDYTKKLYEQQLDCGHYMVDGLAKPMGDEIWFSTSGSDRLDSIKAQHLISGIRESKITAYNSKTNEFRTVFEYDKKGTQIIDFDESGAYILDSKGRFGYVDFETKKLNNIYEFSGIDLISVKDKYICVKYRRNGYTYFVYDRNGSIVANDSSLN
jgi:hypothetical protein